MGNDSYRFHSELKLGQSQKFPGLVRAERQVDTVWLSQVLPQEQEGIKELFFKAISLVS
jgi:hypothetical protein